MVDPENMHTFSGTLSGRNVTGGNGTLSVATVPASVSRRYAYRQKFSNEGSNSKVVQIKQVRHANAYTEPTVVPADGGISEGGNPTEDRLLLFDRAGTINASMSTANGTVAVVMNFVDL